jgi:CRISPR-associated protein Csm3
MANITKKIKLKGQLKLYSGLHIGASKENAQIGGVDSPIIRRKDNDQPYIPGSSLKGKIRCLLEQYRGCDLGQSPEVNSLFGYSDDKTISKLIVRDSYLTNDSAESLKNNLNTDLPYSEVKFENSIDRFKGNVGNPRQIERIPAGAEFDVEFIINVWSDTDESSLLDLINEGIALLNNDYLGGNGTRGYGHVNLSMEQAELNG